MAYGCIAKYSFVFIDSILFTAWDSTRKRFMHRMVRVAVKGNEIHLVSNTDDRFVGTLE